jgi:rSAM/selenodomain-associated transferase 2
MGKTGCKSSILIFLSFYTLTTSNPVVPKPIFSVIIPVLNEAMGIGPLLERLIALSDLMDTAELIVVDGGSRDETCTIAARFPIRLHHTSAGRSLQMNAGARIAETDHLFFLHADSTPPASFTADILQLINTKCVGGCYRLAFDHPHPILHSYAWFTRFDVQAFRYGDQGLYVPAKIFTSIGGFNQDYIVMEDNDIVARLRKWQIKNQSYREFIILEKTMVTSARRYLDNGILKLQLVFAAIYILHQCGIPHDELKRFYIDWIQGRPVV